MVSVCIPHRAALMRLWMPTFQSWFFLTFGLFFLGWIYLGSKQSLAIKGGSSFPDLASWCFCLKSWICRPTSFCRPCISFQPSNMILLFISSPQTLLHRVTPSGPFLTSHGFTSNTALNFAHVFVPTFASPKFAEDYARSFASALFESLFFAFAAEISGACDNMWNSFKTMRFADAVSRVLQLLLLPFFNLKFSSLSQASTTWASSMLALQAMV